MKKENARRDKKAIDVLLAKAVHDVIRAVELQNRTTILNWNLDSDAMIVITGSMMMDILSMVTTNVARCALRIPVMNVVTI
jgi:hypothetical protein